MRRRIGLAWVEGRFIHSSARAFKTFVLNNKSVDPVKREVFQMSRYPRRRQRVYPRRQRAMESSRHGAQPSAKIIIATIAERLSPKRFSQRDLRTGMPS